jgi:hypothetical protein
VAPLPKICLDAFLLGDRVHILSYSGAIEGEDFFQVVRTDGTGMVHVRASALDGDEAMATAKQRCADMRAQVVAEAQALLLRQTDRAFRRTHDRLTFKFHIFHTYGLHTIDPRDFVRCLLDDGRPGDFNLMDLDAQFELSLAQGKCIPGVYEVFVNQITGAIVVIHSVCQETSGTTTKFLESNFQVDLRRYHDGDVSLRWTLGLAFADPWCLTQHASKDAGGSSTSKDKTGELIAVHSTVDTATGLYVVTTCGEGSDFHALTDV